MLLKNKTIALAITCTVLSLLIGRQNNESIAKIIMAVELLAIALASQSHYSYPPSSFNFCDNMLPSKSAILTQVQQALAEDLGTGDVTAQLLPETLVINAIIISREAMVICGIPWVNAIFKAMDNNVKLNWLVQEGSYLGNPATLCEIKGKARAILSAERTALNFLQTLSATATQTRAYQQALQPYKTILLDTRKTLPGLRLAQKYAVTCGGGHNHRLGLYDAFLIKENHIKACGSITKAIQLARIAHPSLFLEIEVETLDELNEALNAKPDRIMLDNFELPMIKQGVLMAKPFGIPLEVSGGVSLTTIRSIAETGVDAISVGSITKSIQAMDLSLQLQEDA